MFSRASSSSISLATVTPSFVTCGAPKAFPIMTLRPFGPRVTFTAFARASTPLFIPSLAAISNSIFFAISTILSLVDISKFTNKSFIEQIDFASKRKKHTIQTA